jgi:hypothetical protein
MEQEPFCPLVRGKNFKKYIILESNQEYATSIQKFHQYMQFDKFERNPIA